MAITKSRDSGIDGLRGIMLLIIVATHYIPTTFFSGNIARPAAAVMLAVTGYFLMRTIERSSLMSQTASKRWKSLPTLLFQRHMRVWPVMVGVVIMYVVLGYVDGGETTRQIHTTWPLYLAYMGNIVKMIYEQNAFPAHFWLISAQEQFVVMLMIGAAIIGPQHLRKFLIFAVWAGVLTRIVACYLFMPMQPSLATETPFAIADAMALGMLCRMAVTAKASMTNLRRSILIALIGVFFVWALSPNTYAFYFGLTPLLAALVGCLIILTMGDTLRGRRFENAMLNWPFVVLLGKMSLSLFLLHPLVNTLLNLGYAQATGQIAPWWMLSLVGPPLSILAALAYFTIVELPIRQYRSKRKMRQEDDNLEVKNTPATNHAG